MERIQGKMLRGMLELPRTTPYWGIFKETGVWPIKENIIYQRMMFLENMMNSKEERLGRMVAMEQRESGRENSWYGETKKYARKLNIDLHWVTEGNKEKWKKLIKERIQEKIEREAESKEQVFRKMRHQKEQRFERKRYLREMGIREASKTMKRRLEMNDIGNNMGKDWKCKCGEKETSEHVIKCKIGNKSEVNVDWLKETDNVDKIRRINSLIESITKERK